MSGLARLAAAILSSAESPCLARQTMPDCYYSLLVRAVTALDSNTVKISKMVYGMARDALVKQARAVTPALREADLTRERLNLERAIRKVEKEELESSTPKKAHIRLVRHSRRCWPISRFDSHSICGTFRTDRSARRADRKSRQNRPRSENVPMNLPAIRMCQAWRVHCHRDHVAQGMVNKIRAFELAGISSF